MTAIYVRSTDGNNADDGSTWALAKADIQTPTLAAGDVVYVSDNHAQSTATPIVITTNGTLAAPVTIVCADDAAEPPTAGATSATVTTTGTSSITLKGSSFIDGLTFNVGSGAVNAYMIVGDTVGEKIELKNCNINVVLTGSAGGIRIGQNSSVSTTGGDTVWRDVNVKFGAAGQGIVNLQSRLKWDGGSLAAGGTSPTTLFPYATSSGRASFVEISGVDLSAGSSSMNIFGAGSGSIHSRKIRNCKLPASWSGSLVTGTINIADRYEMHNCDAGDTNYRLWVEDYAGSIKSETTIVRTGGASDGTTAYSLKMATSANAEYPALALVSPEIAIWNDTTGASKTVSVEFVHDSVTNLKDDEIWLEVQYLGASGFPLSSFVTDCKVSVLATAADQTDSSETWTTTGLTNPNTQKLSVSFTPQEKGYIQARVYLAKASTTVYVDPKLTVA